MNVSTGNLYSLTGEQHKMIEGVQLLPKRLHSFAEAHMAEHPDKPVGLDGDSELSNYARKQRAKGAFGKCKNRPA